VADPGTLPVLAPGPTCYQVKVQLPGGATIVCGATGWRRDWVRGDMAALYRCDPKHVQVTRLRGRR
jgi:hypothetical protein